MTMDLTLTSPRAPTCQDTNAATNAISGFQSAQKPQNEPQTRTSRPRAAAAVAKAVMAEQVKEEGYIGLLFAASSSLEQENGLFSAKKRSKEEVNEPSVKRPKMNDGLFRNNSTLEDISGGKEARGKKRRQANAFEAAPIITDLPPLPFTTSSPDLKVKNKAKFKQGKVKNKASHAEVDGDADRKCEFCKKVTNVCVLMHCHGCRRVYHGGCLLSAFKPFVDPNTPILQQIERVQLDAPERRGNIFRCASCKAAFLDFYESGGYLWDCNCPTCSQPEKLVYYRQRKLLQMMNDMELEKQRKKEIKDQKVKKKSAGTPQAPTPSRSNSTSRSRRTRGGSGIPDEHVVTARTTQPSTSRGVSVSDENLKQNNDVVKAEALNVLNSVKSGLKNVVTNLEPMQIEGKGCQPSELTTMETTQTKGLNVVEQQTDQKLFKQKHANRNITDGEQAVEQDEEIDRQLGEITNQVEQSEELKVSALSVSNEPTLNQMQERQAVKILQEPLGEPDKLELSGSDLVAAVPVVRDDKTGGWFFPVMCSRTSSLRVSGVMKTGKCKWLPKKSPVVQCDCCDRCFSYSQFVNHTDSSLVKDAKNAQEDPMPFLFVQHRDTTQYTLLDDFLPAFRTWTQQQSAANMPTKPHRSHTVNQNSPSSVTSNPDATTGDPPSAPSRLRALALFKRPKHRSEKGSIVERLEEPASMEFVAQVVCLPPNYVMTMAHGELVDRVMSSQMPVAGDSFPRKSGWLPFSRNGGTARNITCMCCDNRFEFDDFVKHAGISLSELQIKSRQLFYIMKHHDKSALVPFKTFLLDLEFVTKNNLFLDELHLLSTAVART